MLGLLSLVVILLLKKEITMINKNAIMELSPRAAELTSLLESRISNVYTNLKVDEIDRVYGLNEIQVGEMVEFASGVKGIALNLENQNVGIIVFSSDTAIKEIALDLLWNLMHK